MSDIPTSSPDHPLNMTDADYWAAVDRLDGGPCNPIPADVIAQAVADIDAREADRG